ncbi:DNA-J related domain-containing protein [Gallaecimonas sp. GXIMD1310]|uniref:DNA-J related domain-containing protein n=1 Tax=Gallaecimonas sp. GXIMD1310 TaxID=3131926 RepID=UPI0032532ECB
MTMTNPLIVELLTLLHRHPDGLSEYALLTALAEHPLLQELDAPGELGLFRRHFALMNALYQLRQRLWDDGWQLAISPLCVQLCPDAPTTAEQALAEHEPLAAYYLDWQELEQTSQADVEALLASFWQRFCGQDERQQALTTLELPTDADWRMIRHRYRVLVMQHHPDRGGNTAEFIAIRRAYEVLAGQQE